jgi:alpha-1,3-rhamnosyl/mannosyltransferase
LPWRSEATRGYDAWYLHRLIPAALERCWGVVTISQASRSDILALWPRLEPKLSVIPHGVGDAYLEATSGPLPPQVAAKIGPGRYILYVGGSLERKRFEWAARIFEALGDNTLRLVVCGFTSDEANQARTSLMMKVQERVCWLPFVAEVDMPRLYQNALAVLYPTLYEGFGFPVLEAQAVGTPVLFSAVGSLSELVGPSSEVLPPHDLEAWVHAARRLLHRRTSERSPVEAARAWARRFSWDVSSARHLELYQEAAHSRA